MLRNLFKPSFKKFLLAFDEDPNTAYEKVAHIESFSDVDLYAWWCQAPKKAREDLRGLAHRLYHVKELMQRQDLSINEMIAELSKLKVNIVDLRGRCPRHQPTIH